MKFAALHTEDAIEALLVQFDQPVQTLQLIITHQALYNADGLVSLFNQMSPRKRSRSELRDVKVLSVYNDV